MSVDAIERIDCYKLLVEQRHSDFDSMTVERLKSLISAASGGRLSGAPYVDTRASIESALRRKGPINSNEVIDKIESGVHLSKVEAEWVAKASYQEFREAKYALLSRTRFPIVEKFIRYGKSRLMRPVDRVDDVWKALGFRIEDSVIISPTYEEITKNLLIYQEKMGIPESLRLKISVVYKNLTDSTYHYHAAGSHLGPGIDVPIKEAFSTNLEYVKALAKNFVIIERDLHDVGHVVGWTAFPEVFDQVRQLGKLHLADPSNLALEHRFYWASEFLLVANPDRSRKGMKSFASKRAWDMKNRSVSEQYYLVRKEIPGYALDASWALMDIAEGGTPERLPGIG